MRDVMQTTHTKADIARLFDLPLMDLLMQAQTVHRQHFNANEVQISTLLSIKTGNCPKIVVTVHSQVITEIRWA